MNELEELKRILEFYHKEAFDAFGLGPDSSFKLSTEIFDYGDGLGKDFKISIWNGEEHIEFFPIKSFLTALDKAKEVQVKKGD